MRKSLIAAAVVAATIFGAGYLFGQLRGVTTSSAANPAAAQSPRFHIGSWRGFHDSFHGGLQPAIGPHVDGKVTAINGDTFTIAPDTARTSSSETETVTSIVVSNSTQYEAGPTGTASKDSVKVGSFVIATGTVSADGKSIEATRVDVMPQMGGSGGPHRFAVGPHAFGSVTAINGDSYTIKPDANRPGGQSAVTTVMVTKDTEYFTGWPGSGAKAGQSDIKIGSYLLAVGTLSANGTTLTATTVVILPSAPGLKGPGSGHLRFGAPFDPRTGQFDPGINPFNQDWRQSNQSQGNI